MVDVLGILKVVRTIHGQRLDVLHVACKYERHMIDGVHGFAVFALQQREHGYFLHHEQIFAI